MAQLSDRAVALTNFVDVLNANEVQSAEDLDRLLPVGLRSRWMGRTHAGGDDWTERVLISARPGSTLLPDAEPIEREANACVVGRLREESGAGPWRLLSVAPPRLMNHEQVSSASLDLSAYTAWHIEDGTAVTLYWGGDDLGWAFASANSADLGGQRWMGKCTFAEYFFDNACRTPALRAAMALDDPNTKDRIVRTLSEKVSYAPVGVESTSAANVAGPIVDIEEAGTDCAKTECAKTECATDCAKTEAVKTEAATQPRVPAAEQPKVVMISSEIIVDQYPNLDRKLCYTIGFRHPNLHPFAPALDPQRVWHIRTYDPRECREIPHAESPLSGLPGQRLFGAECPPVEELVHECADAYVNAVGWLTDPGATGLDRRPNYGYILRYTPPEGEAHTQPDILVESPLMRAIRWLVYQRPPANVNARIDAPHRFAYMAYQALLAGRRAEFEALFPKFAAVVERYNQFTNTVVDLMVQLCREASGRRTSFAVAVRTKKSPAGEFAARLLGHAQKYLGHNPNSPHARSVYYDNVVRPENALLFFEAFKRSEATRPQRRRQRAR